MLQAYCQGSYTAQSQSNGRLRPPVKKWKVRYEPEAVNRHHIVRRHGRLGGLGGGMMMW
jgi:hypothetical protein